MAVINPYILALGSNEVVQSNPSLVVEGQWERKGFSLKSHSALLITSLGLVERGYNFIGAPAP
jgi:hypothetical protein